MNIQQNELAKLAGPDFFQLAKREPHPRTRIRLLALGNLQQGKTKREIINTFHITFPTLREWLLRFISEGVEGLRERPGKGRKKSYRPIKKKNSANKWNRCKNSVKVEEYEHRMFRFY